MNYEGTKKYYKGKLLELQKTRDELLKLVHKDYIECAALDKIDEEIDKLDSSLRKTYESELYYKWYNDIKVD